MSEKYQNCPVCGSLCTIGGNKKEGTHYYVPVDSAHRAIEELKKRLSLYESEEEELGCSNCNFRKSCTRSRYYYENEKLIQNPACDDYQNFNGITLQNLGLTKRIAELTEFVEEVTKFGESEGLVLSISEDARALLRGESEGK